MLYKFILQVHAFCTIVAHYLHMLDKAMRKVVKKRVLLELKSSPVDYMANKSKIGCPPIQILPQV